METFEIIGRDQVKTSTHHGDGNSYLQEIEKKWKFFITVSMHMYILIDDITRTDLYSNSRRIQTSNHGIRITCNLLTERFEKRVIFIHYCCGSLWLSCELKFELIFQFMHDALIVGMPFLLTIQKLVIVNACVLQFLLAIKSFTNKKLSKTILLKVTRRKGVTHSNRMGKLAIKIEWTLFLVSSIACIIGLETTYGNFLVYGQGIIENVHARPRDYFYLF